MFPRRKSKYGNKKTVIDGIKFDSKREASRWCDLRLMLRAGAIADLKRQVPYQVSVNSVPVFKYMADFTYLRNGVLVVEDSKGMRTPIYRLKKRCVEAQYGITIREV